MIQTFIMLATLAVVGYLFYKIKKARDVDMKRINEDRDQAKLDREAALALRIEIMKILTLIHGWVVVSVKTGEKAKLELEKETKNVHDKMDSVENKVDALPIAVAEEVEKRTTH